MSDNPSLLSIEQVKHSIMTRHLEQLSKCDLVVNLLENDPADAQASFEEMSKWSYDNFKEVMKEGFKKSSNTVYGSSKNGSTFSDFVSSMTKVIVTKPFDDQKLGIFGLRKRTEVFQQKHYTENFIQSILNSIDAEGSTLVVGGDGGSFSSEVHQIILQIGSANGVKKFIIGKDGILSTPATSNTIRKYKATGGIILTASYYPGGPTSDANFGIKYNESNGGPAPESVTNKIFENSQTIKSYKVIQLPAFDLSKIGEYTYGPTQVSIINPIADYGLNLP